MRVDIFRGLPLQEIDALSEDTIVKHFSAETVLYRPEEVDQRIFVLLHGQVDLYRLTTEGKRLVTRRVAPGSIFGEMALLGQIPQGCFAEATKDSLVCVVTRERMLRIIARHPEVAERVLLAAYSHLEKLEERLEQASFSPVRVRLAHFLLANVDPDSGVVAGFTQAEIGDTIGALRKTVTETLSELRRLGLVKVAHKRISVVNLKDLQEVALGQAETRRRDGPIPVKPESTEGGRLVSILKWPEGAPLNLG